MWDKAEVQTPSEHINVNITLCVNYRNTLFWLIYSIVYLDSEYLLQTFWQWEMKAFYKVSQYYLISCGFSNQGL